MYNKTGIERNQIKQTCSGFETIMWVSKIASGRDFLRHETSGGPKERLGTKCPSITSKCKKSAPAERRREPSDATADKSAFSTEGPIWQRRLISTQPFDDSDLNIVNGAERTTL